MAKLIVEYFGGENREYNTPTWSIDRTANILVLADKDANMQSFIPMSNVKRVYIKTEIDKEMH